MCDEFLQKTTTSLLNPGWGFGVFPRRVPRASRPEHSELNHSKGSRSVARGEKATRELSPAGAGF